MLVKHHVMVSLSGGVIFYIVTQSLFKAAVFGLVGIFIDLDHLFDYVRHFGWKIVNFREFSRVFYKCELKKIYVLLHSYEVWVGIGIVLWYLKPDWGWAAFLSLTIHFLMDHLYFFTHFKEVKPWFYFLTYRLSRGFELESFKQRR